MRFSVIMPLFNKAPYVAKAIRSVLEQTFKDYEMIIVDDGSKDDSAKVAASSIEGHSNCRLIKQDNTGVSVARNNGVELSQSDYLCFLDADDWWAPTFLEEMSRLIEEFPDAGIYGVNYTIVNETKHKTRVADIGVESGFEKGYINYCRAYASTMYMPLWTGAVCIPRMVFSEMQGFPQGIKLGEDFLLWIHIALNYKVVFLNKPLSYYNQDVDAANRGIGQLRRPEEHMLWNLGDLEVLEETNDDYKQLIDRLRIYGLFPYYLSNEHRKYARAQLNKINWEKQPNNLRRLYKYPVFVLKMDYFFKRIGSFVKRFLRANLNY